MASVEIHFLLDQGLPRDAVGHLRAAGVACTHVGEIGMSASADTDILDWARGHDLAVITLDADFHAILATSHASAPSVVRIRIQGLGATELSKMITELLVHYPRRGEYRSGRRGKSQPHFIAQLRSHPI